MRLRIYIFNVYLWVENKNMYQCSIFMFLHKIYHIFSFLIFSTRWKLQNGLCSVKKSDSFKEEVINSATQRSTVYSIDKNTNNATSTSTISMSYLDLANLFYFCVSENSECTDEIKTNHRVHKMLIHVHAF